MDRQFSLIKNGQPNREKRIFPRFPYNYLTFKCDSRSNESAPKSSESTPQINANNLSLGEKSISSEERCSNLDSIFEVNDVSFTHLYIALRGGRHTYLTGDKICGKLRWHGQEIYIEGKVKWSTDNSIYITILEHLEQLEQINQHMRGLIQDVNYPTSSNHATNDLKSFLSVHNVALGLKAIHQLQQSELSLDLPRFLKYWLHAGCLLEIFIWQHSNNEFSRFQIIFLGNFLEWEDGIGIKTGRTISKREIETPLSEEDEVTLSIDNKWDPHKLELFREVVKSLTSKHIPLTAIEFLLIKLSF